MSLWHLCSLDAPTVAVLWTWFIAHINGLALPASSLVAMGLAVWILYAADRLLDARLLDARLLDARLPTASTAATNELEARHFFHHRHWKPFLTGILACSFALIPLLLQIPFATIRLYLIEGSLLIGWFLLIHATRSALRLPKELAVGLFFAAAVFIPTVSRNPALRLPLIVPALLFAALCSLNCLYIYAWEHEAQTTLPQRAHPSTRFALAHLPWLAAILAAASLAVSFATHSQLAEACTLSVAALYLLHATRRRLHRTTLRAAADLALLTPVLLVIMPR